MKLKIPPALVAVFIAGMMWLLNYLLPVGNLYLPGTRLVAVTLFVIGGIIGVISLYQFFKIKTTINPHNPEKTSQLVVNGLYNVSRNPMYLALFILLVAYATVLHNIFNLLILPIFVWYMNRFQIIPEEQALSEKFGEDFEEYRSQVRRWL
ncbi:MAG: isoprenylcysteine carboxylmethyltransferase family protein [Balneolaceae bacterium]|nr:isoprenylcysteine carboxylmethyltransferase family protein [Balneolaceae bacterium]